jgi:hypothetical protein
MFTCVHIDLLSFIQPFNFNPGLFSSKSQMFIPATKKTIQNEKPLQRICFRLTNSLKAGACSEDLLELNTPGRPGKAGQPLTSIMIAAKAPENTTDIKIPFVPLTR